MATDKDFITSTAIAHRERSKTRKALTKFDTAIDIWRATNIQADTYDNGNLDYTSNIWRTSLSTCLPNINDKFINDLIRNGVSFEIVSVFKGMKKLKEQSISVFASNMLRGPSKDREQFISAMENMGHTDLAGRLTNYYKYHDSSSSSESSADTEDREEAENFRDQRETLIDDIYDGIANRI